MPHAEPGSRFIRKLVIYGLAGIIAAVLLFAFATSQGAPSQTPTPSPTISATSRPRRFAKKNPPPPPAESTTCGSCGRTMEPGTLNCPSCGMGKGS